MPVEPVIAEFCDLFDSLLHLVFAKIPLSCGNGLSDALKGLFFANGEQSDGSRVTPSIYGSFRQQIADFAQVFRDPNHVLLPMLRYTRPSFQPGYGKSGCLS